MFFGSKCAELKEETWSSSLSSSQPSRKCCRRSFLQMSLSCVAEDEVEEEDVFFFSFNRSVFVLGFFPYNYFFGSFSL